MLPFVHRDGGHSGPKSRCTVPKLNKSLDIDKSMSKISTKLLSQAHLSARKSLKINQNIWKMIYFGDTIKRY